MPRVLLSNGGTRRLLALEYFCPGRPVWCDAVFRHLRVFNRPARARLDDLQFIAHSLNSHLSTLLARGVCRSGRYPWRDSADRCSSVSRAGHDVLRLQRRMDAALRVDILPHCLRRHCAAGATLVAVDRTELDLGELAGALLWPGLQQGQLSINSEPADVDLLPSICRRTHRSHGDPARLDRSRNTYTRTLCNRGQQGDAERPLGFALMTFGCVLLVAAAARPRDAFDASTPNLALASLRDGAMRSISSMFRSSGQWTLRCLLRRRFFGAMVGNGRRAHRVRDCFRQSRSRAVPRAEAQGRPSGSASAAGAYRSLRCCYGALWRRGALASHRDLAHQ